MRIADVLVDYDNVVRAAKPERTPTDTEANLAELMPALCHCISVACPSVEELVVRLYGGWLDIRGRLTARAEWLTRALPNYRRRIDGVRVRPSIALALVAFPAIEYLGTYRVDVRGEQKMVDTMLALDAVTVSRVADGPVVLVSDDDDFVPAQVVSCFTHQRRSSVCLVRREKPIGTAPNDTILQQNVGVRITMC